MAIFFAFYLSRNLGWGINIPNMTFFQLVIIFSFLKIFMESLYILVILSNSLIEENIGLNFSSSTYDKVKDK